MINITGNEPIYEAQRFLRTIHYETNGKIPLVSQDGIYGERTRAAVNEFQRLAGLPMTGQIDYDTWTALYEAYRNSLAASEPPVPLILFPIEKGYRTAQGEKSDIVFIIQFILRSLANEHDDIRGADPNGVYDAATMNDVRHFQKLYGLPETGLTDRDTWNKLADAYRGAAHEYE